MMQNMNSIEHPPSRSKGILSDIRFFLLHKPKIHTLIEFNSEEERENYSKRIHQRLDESVTDYIILNIHKIGIDVPVKYVFEELSRWNGDSTCWPNHIATVERTDDSLDQIRIFLFGRKKYPLWFKNSFFGFKYIPLFSLDAIKVQHIPDPLDVDNARYLLYKCSGGYPIGIFSMYTRSPIAAQNETEHTQLFLVVGFNFYGDKKMSKYRLVNKAWEKIHNRVTENIMNRFKQLCEWRFHKIQEGRGVVEMRSEKDEM
jgi:hypothetical protein